MICAVVQSGKRPLGAVMLKVTPAPGWVAPATPVTVAVKVIGLLMDGDDDGVRVMSGVCLSKVRAAGALEAMV